MNPSEQPLDLEGRLAAAHRENERLRNQAEKDCAAAYREGFRDAERATDERHWDYLRGNVIAGIVAAMTAPEARQALEPKT